MNEQLDEPTRESDARHETPQADEPAAESSSQSDSDREAGGVPAPVFHEAGVRESDLVLPILPVRNTVLYPFVLMPVSLGRAASMAAVEAALHREDKLLAVFAQKDPEVEFPAAKDLYPIGTRAVIRRMARGEETLELILQGVERIELEDLTQTEPYLEGRLKSVPVPDDESTEAEALTRELVDMAREFQPLGHFSPEIDFGQVVAQIDDPMHLVYLLSMVARFDTEDAQAILTASTRLEAMKLLHEHLSHELKVQELRQEIAGAAHSEMNREQREYMLRQQLRAIQEELGEDSPEEAEVASLRQRLEEVELPENVRKEAERELNRLGCIPAASPDHQVARGWLELVLELPWTASTDDQLDLARARKILDEDHYGLDEIKERILEHLAVMKLNPQAQAPILCFVGPPGVGKTSLGQSIARALGRKFERFSLGGMHDESELRGHRRTYIGAMPGRLIQAVRRAGVNNPLLMLDELDKLGRDFRGDPASALLEILDPAQNNDFRDNYLDVPFDLSRIFFITTANTLDTIPRPLLDRMETIRLSGYYDEEKLQIALRDLLPRRREHAGLSEEQFQVPDDTLRKVIHSYTREAGVRELERQLGRLARKVALGIAEGQGDKETGGQGEGRTVRGGAGSAADGPASAQGVADDAASSSPPDTTHHSPPTTHGAAPVTPAAGGGVSSTADGPASAQGVADDATSSSPPDTTHHSPPTTHSAAPITPAAGGGVSSAADGPASAKGVADDAASSSPPDTTHHSPPTTHGAAPVTPAAGGGVRSTADGPASAQGVADDATSSSPPDTTHHSPPTTHSAAQPITPADLADMLGPERFFLEQARKDLQPGVATGLAWTETGGDVLYVEAICLPEAGKLTLTGKLGDVMQESAVAARNYVLSKADDLGFEAKDTGVHIHVPAGAIPKDGPSAGVTMATAIASLFTDRPVRSDTAMTGEITLTGLVLPVGGVKEKVLAAHRAGLRRAILPKENERDLPELPQTIKDEVDFIFAERIEDVLAAALSEAGGGDTDAASI